MVRAGGREEGAEESVGSAVINPHFDEDRVVWKDEYSGLYHPVDYGAQFDDQWRLFLEGGWASAGIPASRPVTRGSTRGSMS